jgi:hypothetical protein
MCKRKFRPPEAMRSPAFPAATAHLNLRCRFSSSGIPTPAAHELEERGELVDRLTAGRKKQLQVPVPFATTAFNCLFVDPSTAHRLGLCDRSRSRAAVGTLARWPTMLSRTRNGSLALPSTGSCRSSNGPVTTGRRPTETSGRCLPGRLGAVSHSSIGRKVLVLAIAQGVTLGSGDG